MNYTKRREKLAKQLENDSIFILFNKKLYEDATKFEACRNFYYLTGILEYDDILIIKKENNKVINKIYINRIDEVREKWTGKVLRDFEVKELNPDVEISYIDNFEKDLDVLVNGVERIYTLYREDSIAPYSYEDKFRKTILGKYNKTLVSINEKIKRLRKEKDEEEIALIKEANHITNLGLNNLLANLKPNLYEYQLESYFDQAIKFNGATGHSFSTICAGGINATCLHYSENNCKLNDGDLVLLDLGASLNTYCADISRTYPINGKFTERQKLVYNIVLNGQKLIESISKPGLTTKDLNKRLIEYFAVELKRIGLIKKDEEVIKYYFHGVSHHLGMDCHDFCPYDALTSGCVISNEPGLYIPQWNIGIRIEDDLLITEDGCINLSKDIIKEVDDIEKIMSKYANR